jgi:molybdopterin converting factor small subunit
MIKVTILTHFKGELENLAINGLKETIQEMLSPFAQDIKKEGGRVNVTIKSLDEVNVEIEGLSKKLKDSILASLDQK